MIESTKVEHSPLRAFVDTVSSMGANRKLLASMPGADMTLLEDLEMMMREGVIIGLRSKWARRVAVPILQANRALAARGDVNSNAEKALEILKQCTDQELADKCAAWIRGTYVAAV